MISASWSQALPHSLAELLDLPFCLLPECVLLSETGEIREQGKSYQFFSKNRKISGLVFEDATTVAEAVTAFMTPATAADASIWAVFECFDAKMAEYWKQTLQHRAHATSVFRKGYLILAYLPKSFLLSGSASFKQAVNPDGTLVPDGVATFPSEDNARHFLTQILPYSQIDPTSHKLSATETDQASFLAGFDLGSFRRIGSVIDDPEFLSGISATPLRNRLRSLFQTNTLSHLSNTDLLGTRTAQGVEHMVESLLANYSTEMPKFFKVLRPAVVALEKTEPVGSPTGAMAGALGHQVTAKLAFVLAVVASHRPDFTLINSAMGPEQLFFWILYGHPAHLVAAAAREGVTITTHVLPAYPKVAFNDPTLRKPILNLLDKHPPHTGDSWEMSFLARCR